MYESNLSVTAIEIESGDFIPALDNAYIFDVDPTPDFRDEYNGSIGRGLICFTFHDRNGDEGYLLLDPNMEVQVYRP